MGRNRLEAFSDGVIAIIITIMVIEMKVPHGENMAALLPVLPVFLSYIMSFIYVGIYWNNHHNMLQASGKITGSILWANLHLLFWLSLFPFVTSWMGENHFATAPTELYGVVLFMAAIAYFILQQRIIAAGAPTLRRAIGRDWKGKVSPIFYFIGIISAQWSPTGAKLIYLGLAFLWLIPDRRIESLLIDSKE
ncbi:MULTISPECIES: TMEM175 family protein [Acidithiobacillus]|jgi:uncharacterized membrane protein|uniref:TMEM175 family protein n=1 Tax=Acidithiobacillus TaxID=119977 RepID=UPI0004E274AD|nr:MULTISPECIES: TMEM175 family protein [Acidithiobacillus]MBE7565982.1 DUF1211 domain-containing protein [Acidithiobacillus sp. HP-11]MBU2742531.1 DUF1211 domain-containing protein [Acidithiobacillus albertensis]MBU2750435.1 DUF1211 domain-containing protein [Acidithiobacillus thiooxidans]MBU2794183.1 DUF1211 domain-containing protein [Acidithiobacillus thiooxidans]MBU2837055.1 DUF1211 domain-containing protein [Acidithiobacillus thiooxidans]